VKELYYRIVTALTMPKDDGGYSTETVVVTAALILVGIAAVAGIKTFVDARIESFGG
jgi:hypothetical protein